MTTGCHGPLLFALIALALAPTPAVLAAEGGARTIIRGDPGPIKRGADEPREVVPEGLYVPEGNREAYTVLPFSTLEGRTLVDRGLVGEVLSVTFATVTGQRLRELERLARIDGDERMLRIDAGEAPGVASIIVGGTAGTIELYRARTPLVERDGRRLPIPRDGEVEIRDGGVRETLVVNKRFTDMSAPPIHYSVLINRMPVHVLAVRETEWAIVGEGVPLPTEGASLIRITAPGGAQAQARVPSWGFSVHVPAVAFVGESVPVMFGTEGVAASETLSIEFVPARGQLVEPKQVVLTGAQLKREMEKIAQLTAQVAGKQIMLVRVKRGPPAAWQPAPLDVAAAP
jgi:hypothetical protein